MFSSAFFAWWRRTTRKKRTEILECTPREIRGWLLFVHAFLWIWLILITLAHSQPRIHESDNCFQRLRRLAEKPFNLCRVIGLFFCMSLMNYTWCPRFAIFFSHCNLFDTFNFFDCFIFDIKFLNNIKVFKCIWISMTTKFIVCNV